MSIIKNVERDKKHLKECTVKELLEWAINNNIRTKRGFTSFKKALSEIDIDYNLMILDLEEQIEEYEFNIHFKNYEIERLSAGQSKDRVKLGKAQATLRNNLLMGSSSIKIPSVKVDKEAEPVTPIIFVPSNKE